MYTQEDWFYKKDNLKTAIEPVHPTMWTLHTYIKIASKLISPIKL